LQQPGLLAADIGASAAVQIKVHVIAGAAGILAEEPRVVGLLDRDLEVLRLVVELAANVDVGRGRTHAGAGDETTFEQPMRVIAQDFAVLACAGLALVGIDDEIVRPLGLLRHERPFESGREAGAAAPAQPRLLDLLDDPVAALENDVLGAVPDAAAARAGKTPIVLAIEVGEDAVLVSEHRSPRACERPPAVPPALRSASSCP